MHLLEGSTIIKKISHLRWILKEKNEAKKKREKREKKIRIIEGFERIDIVNHQLNIGNLHDHTEFPKMEIMIPR